MAVKETSEPGSSSLSIPNIHEASSEFTDAIDNAFLGIGQHSQLQQNKNLQNTAYSESYNDPSIENLLELQADNTYSSTTTRRSFFPSTVDVGVYALLQLKQQQQQQHSFINRKTLSTTYTLSDSAFLPDNFPDNGNNSIINKTVEPAQETNPDPWLETLEIKCPDVTLEPLTGSEVLRRVRSRTNDVVTRYLPCVEFLVMCQDILRASLAAAPQKRLVIQQRNKKTPYHRDSMTTPQQLYYQEYFDPLSDNFYQRNKTIMEPKVMTASLIGIKKLCADSKQVEYQDCEAMKNTFLGGMRDGESWGLRRWLSKHGGALHICHDLESILRSCYDNLDRSTSSQKLGERLRPLAQQALERLQNNVPTSYQKQSTAHPYLPFFHRLEFALKGMANFYPSGDNVISIIDDDDNEVEGVKQLAAAREKEGQTKRKMDDCSHYNSFQNKLLKMNNDTVLDLKPAAKRSFAESDDDDSSVEIVAVKPAPNGNVTTTNFDVDSKDVDQWDYFMFNTSSNSNASNDC